MKEAPCGSVRLLVCLSGRGPEPGIARPRSSRVSDLECGDRLAGAGSVRKRLSFGEDMAEVAARHLRDGPRR